MQEGLPQGLGVVEDVEPVANVQSIAIDGDGLSGCCAGDDQRDELLRELPWAIGVRSMRGDGVEAVGLVVATDEVVTGGFARGVGRVWRVRRGLGEVACGAAAAEDFIGADMHESSLGSGV